MTHRVDQGDKPADIHEALPLIEETASIIAASVQEAKAKGASRPAIDELLQAIFRNAAELMAEAFPSDFCDALMDEMKAAVDRHLLPPPRLH